MSKKNYTKFSEDKKETENKNEEIIVEPTIETTELIADGEVVAQNTEVKEKPENVTFAVTEENDGVHVRPAVDGEILDTPVAEIDESGVYIHSIPDEEVKTEKPTNVEPEVEPTIIEKPAKVGIVVNCNKLYVRAEADKKAEALRIIEKGEEVFITDDELTMFYGVRTAAGVDGYCVAEFIEIK